jgi:hypothetical protein
MKIKMGLLALALVIVVAQPPVLANGAPTITWWAFAGGGSTTIQGSSSLTGVVGQGTAGQVANGSSSLCSGLLCGVWPYDAYLPFVMNGSP